MKKRWLKLIAVFVLLIVFGPYVASRLNSHSRSVRTYTTSIKTESSAIAKAGICIVSYNIAHGRGLAISNWSGGDSATKLERLDQIAELLIEFDADIVVLNEVDFESSWSHSVNQAKYLAEKVGYQYWVEQRNLDVSILKWKWQFGNAVLSRFPIVNASLIDLPDDAAWETIVAGKKRGLVCEIKIPDQPIRLIATHLSSRSEEVRVESAKMLTKIAANSILPVVVVGDLNSTPSNYPYSQVDLKGDNAIDLFDDSGLFVRSPSGPVIEVSQMTFPADVPVRLIDWVLIPTSSSFQDYRVGSSELSDHRPVIATID